LASLNFATAPKLAMYSPSQKNNIHSCTEFPLENEEWYLNAVCGILGIFVAHQLIFSKFYYQYYQMMLKNSGKPKILIF
jgi:hypothetical protein